MPGYEDIDVYPAHPDLQRARDLAGWHPGDPSAEHGLLPQLWCGQSGAYDIVRQNLAAIGFE